MLEKDGRGPKPEKPEYIRHLCKIKAELENALRDEFVRFENEIGLKVMEIRVIRVSRTANSEDEVSRVHVRLDV